MEDINPDDIIDMCVTKDGLALIQVRLFSFG